MTRDVEFALVVEAGPLEPQGLMLVESLRRFGGSHADATVTVASPRPTRRPSPTVVAELRRLGAEYVELDIDSNACPDYVTSWRAHTMAELEERPGPPVLIQLDTDTLFVDDVGELCTANAVAAARPIDVKGMTSTGDGDAFDTYWAELCRLGGVDLDALPFVTSTVDEVRVRASHNGGFVAARRDLGLFGRASEVLRRAVDADLRPHAGRDVRVRAGSGDVSREGSEWWGSAQAVVTVAAASLGVEIAPLDLGINVPMHLWDRLPVEPSALLHAHYHALFAEGADQGSNPLLDGRATFPPEPGAWLRRWVDARPTALRTR